MALRAMPRVGGRVSVDFLGTTVAGTVAAILGDGRELDVETDDGRRLRFALNRATATFMLDGQQTGARLRFEDQARR